MFLHPSSSRRSPRTRADAEHLRRALVLLKEAGLEAEDGSCARPGRAFCAGVHGQQRGRGAHRHVRASATARRSQHNAQVPLGGLRRHQGSGRSTSTSPPSPGHEQPRPGVRRPVRQQGGGPGGLGYWRRTWAADAMIRAMQVGQDAAADAARLPRPGPHHRPRALPDPAMVYTCTHRMVYDAWRLAKPPGGAAVLAGEMWVIDTWWS